MTTKALAAIMACALLGWLTGMGMGSTGSQWHVAWSPTDPLFDLRWPRVALGALVGAGLGTAGATLQALLRNPLADPYIVGVSGGAALGGVLMMALGLTAPWLLPVGAFAGATVTTLGLLGLAHARGRHDPVTLLLVGVVFNAFAAAVITLVKALLPAAEAQGLMLWLVGSLDHPTPSALLALLGYVLVSVGALWRLSGVLNLVALGDEQAATLGLPVARARLVVFLITSLLVGAVVSMAGLVGFVGLAVPHIARTLWSADHRVVVPASTVLGAALVVFADALARASFGWLGSTLPVGIVTAFLGAPFFLHLLLRRR